MSVSSVKTGDTGISLLVGNTAYDPSAYWFIERNTLTSNTASVSFTSIPTTYQHLQLRILARDTVASSSVANIHLRFNDDSGTNYVWHRVEGDGTNVPSSSAGTNQTYGLITNCSIGNSATSGIFGASIIDIHDYASTTKNKTVRGFGGADKNAQYGALGLSSNLWLNTSAINKITVIAGSTSFLSGSTFGLYGIKG